MRSESPLNINPTGVCVGGYCAPPWLPDIRPPDVANALRDCDGGDRQKHSILLIWTPPK